MRTQIDDRRFGSRERLAWLLRTNRLHGQQEEFRRLRQFAESFPDGARVSSISTSQVSRWETGHTLPTASVLTRYEEVLGLPASMLTTATDAIFRYAGSRLGAPVLLRSAPSHDDELQNQLDALIDPVMTGGVMDGAAWDELSYLLITHPSIFLPSRVWTGLAERLLSEMVIAEGIPWFQRFEALSRLIGHPLGQHATIASCGAMVNDSSNQVFMDPLSLLDGSRHRDANRHVTDQLTAPTNDQALRGALLASVRKVRDHHFTEKDLTALYDVLIQHVSDTDGHVSARPLAIEVLRLLPNDSTPQRSRSLDRALRNDAVLRQVLDTGRVVHAAATAATVSRICAPALAAQPDSSGTDVEAGLRTLVDEMLHSPVSDVRLLAAQTLAATPLRYLVADGLITEIRSRVTSTSPILAVAILGALPFLARQEHRNLVEQLAVCHPLPSEITNGAIWALAHLPGQSTECLLAPSPVDAPLDLDPNPSRPGSTDPARPGVRVRCLRQRRSTASHTQRHTVPSRNPGRDPMVAEHSKGHPSERSAVTGWSHSANPALSISPTAATSTSTPATPTFR
ncbi:helix-turn-helix domain-containing protein [Actinophytocola gossypii]|uniref:Helix-turn-helix transcriptional regulator n=1 Tax=Actinophytocola gossypii TaxID=2812003 RepID=A0ABT2J9X7_9PSEU|nr:helix-turn-helix transcriptional regulator [Actinophytocola gossypii]MCT2584645.1 helix-turn-helix transcriptional regulator [Actinophytocola gossypii]